MGAQVRSDLNQITLYNLTSKLGVRLTPQPQNTLLELVHAQRSVVLLVGMCAILF